MLQNLHVKNLALIDEIEVDFKEGLNTDRGDRSGKIYYSWFGQPCAWSPVFDRYFKKGCTVWFCGTDLFNRK